MLDLSISIQIKEKQDLEIVVDAIKTIGVEQPVYILDYGDSYNIHYDTNEYVEGIESALNGKFPNYVVTENIGIGPANIKVIVTIMQSPASSDNWGRPFNSDTITTTYYFIEERAESQPVLPEENIRVLFGIEEKSYPIFITPVIHKTESNKKGFIVTKTPFKKESPQDLLSDQLFAMPEGAVWEGYRRMEQNIEKDYVEFVNSQKKKRRKKSEK